MMQRWAEWRGDQRAWLGIAAGLVLAAALLSGFRGAFGAEQELSAYPARSLATGLVLAGLLFLGLVPLIRAAEHLKGRELRRRLRLIIVVGLALRLMLLWSTPALEDDFYRYLWDGGVAAHGHNPYRFSPNEAGETGLATAAIKALATDADVVHARINHPNLKTIYPPVTQAAFALAYTLEPWSLLAWRLVCVAGELATLMLVLALLRDVQRSPLWIAVYWWNPVVIKELINSAHMEAILMPLVLAALLLAGRHRPLWATGALALAAGAKLWPVILAPLLWRQLLSSPRQLAVAVGLMLGACALWALPAVIAGLGDESGFVAYATHWKTNSALMPTLERLLHLLLQPMGVGEIGNSRMARLMVALALTVAVACIVRQPLRGADDLMARALWIIAALLLLSPSQFPWYLVWLQPLLCLRPVRGWLLATVLLPLYYVSFYCYALDRAWIFREIVVWLIWLPIWAVLIWDHVLTAAQRRRCLAAGATLRRFGAGAR
jgi:alpha-1,6-mannosyltransferase